MSRPQLTTLISLALTLAVEAAPLAAADYRGTTAGWPAYPNGPYAAYYPQSAGGGPAYYVARPTVPAYAGARPAGMAYVPVRAAYANPTYYAAYSAPPRGYRAAPASYAPTTAYYAPQPGAAYYAPVPQTPTASRPPALASAAASLPSLMPSLQRSTMCRRGLPIARHTPPSRFTRIAPSLRITQ
jgi:hypothetical protein